VRAFVLIAIVFVPASAEAANGTAVSFTIDAHGQWLRALPTVQTEQTEIGLRSSLPETKHRLPGGAAFVGAQAIYGVVIDDRWIYPLVGVGVGTAAGRYRPTPASVDGSIAQLNLWTARYYTLLLPGIGMRGKDRRWMGQIVLRPGIAWLALDGHIASGAHPFEMTANAKASFFVRAEIEACRRLDPVSRVCAFLAPSLYEHTWFGGAQLGLRWEMGP